MLVKIRILQSAPALRHLAAKTAQRLLHNGRRTYHPSAAVNRSIAAKPTWRLELFESLVTVNLATANLIAV